MKKNKKRPWFLIIISIVIIGGLGYFYFRKWQDSKAFKIEIDIDEINVREEPTLYSNKVGKVKKGQIYKVLDIDLTDNRYVWYKIKMQNNGYGWVATGRNNRYVIEINNPKGEGDEEFVADYGTPKIKFYENEITFTDIDSINYDHITITDDSNCEKIAQKKYEKAKEKNPKTKYCQLSHEIYYEADPPTTHIPQYWIRYIVEDEAGNSSSKVQKIIFLNEPDSSKVKDFNDMPE